MQTLKVPDATVLGAAILGGVGAGMFSSIEEGAGRMVHGYSLRFPEDMENLEHQFEVYDALYAWCRLQVAKGE